MSDSSINDKEKFHVAYGGTEWMDETSSSSYNDYFDPRYTKDQSYRRRWATEGEPSFYEEKWREINENPWYEFFADHATDTLTDSIYFEGPGAEEVINYFDEIDQGSKIHLRKLVWSAVVFGTGFQYKYKNRNGKLAQLYTPDATNFGLSYSPFNKENPDPRDKNAMLGEERWVEITDGGTSKRYYMRNYPRIKASDKIHPNIALLKLREDLKTPYGRSMGRGCWHHIKGLKGVDWDILSAIKRLMSLPMSVDVDLDNIDDDEKVTKLKQATEAYEKVDWAAIDVIAKDQRVKMGLIGMLPDSRDPSDGRIINVIEKLQSILLIVMSEFLFPPGILLQMSSNKSVVSEQTKYMAKRERSYKDQIRRYLKEQIIPQITDKDVDVRFMPSLSPEEAAILFKAGAISREYLRETLGIVDNGETFVPIDKGGETTSLNSKPDSMKMEKDNNDDNPTNHRQGENTQTNNSPGGN